MVRPLAIVDLDGVVADVRHRLVHLTGRRKDWDAFFAAAVDGRPAAVVKPELLRTIAQGREVAVVVDDDERVVEAMRRAGYQVLHADWEKRAAEEEAALEQAQEEQGRT